MEPNTTSVKLETSIWTEFLEHPTLFNPAPEFLAPTYFIEEETVLTSCIRSLNIPAVEALIRAGADPNLPSRKGVTPISAAAHKGNISLMQLLIDAGAAVNSLNSSGSTALIQAAHFGHVEAVKLLLRNNATADFANGKGTTALMRASQEGHVEISNCLIAADVDVNRKNLEGMNALMLASQRGHSDMVLLLIKVGAAMDEQTAQGSTALMLACKRGHEKCAEVLVAMGAEIFMRDRRGRTAKDTATRRNHFRLLVWLDTQVQIARIQDFRHKQRTAYLMELRQASNKNCLQLASVEHSIASLVTAVQHDINNCTTQRDRDVIAEFLKASQAANTSTTTASALTGSSLLSTASAGLALRNPLASSQSLPCLPPPPSPLSFSPTSPCQPLPPPTYISSLQSTPPAIANSSGDPNVRFPVISKYPTEALHQIRTQLSLDVNAITRSLPMYSKSCTLASRMKGYCEWQWPSLLQRVLTMPPGIFEHIVDFMPLPRVWQWSLMRLKARCKLCPLQALVDISILMDEILIDANIFGMKNQSNLLVLIARNPQLHGYLMEQLGMPEPLLQSLVTWADIQSLLQRSSEVEVTFKTQMARQMHTAAIALYRWHRHRSAASKALRLVAPSAVNSSSGYMPLHVLRAEHDESGPYGDEAEMMEATDAGGEDEDDDVSDEEGNAAGPGGGATVGGVAVALPHNPTHHQLQPPGVLGLGLLGGLTQQQPMDMDSDNEQEGFMGPAGNAFDGMDSDDDMMFRAP